MLRELRLPALVMLFTLLGTLSAEARGRRSGSKSKKRHGDLVLYRRTTCPICDRLEGFLKGNHVPYTVQNHSQRPEDGMTLHRTCMERRVSCRGYPLLEEDGNIIESGSMMYAFLLRIDNRYRVLARDEPLAAPPEGDGNAAERARRRNSYSGDTGSSVSTR